MGTGHATSSFRGSEYPSILASDELWPRGQRASPPRHESSGAMPMNGARAIPGNHDVPAPPPLPPPRVFPPEVLNHHDGAPYSDRDNYKSRGPSYRTDYSNEDYLGQLSHRPPRSSHSTMRTADVLPYSDYDNEMLKKLNTRRTLDNRSPTRPRWSGLSSSAQDTTTRAFSTQPPKLGLSLPGRTQHRPTILAESLAESPYRITHTPPSSALSPISSGPYSHAPSPSVDYRSPIARDTPEYDRYPPAWGGRATSSLADDMATSTQGSYDTREDDADFETSSRLRGLSIEDQARERERERERGQKRRASSPLGDDKPLPSDFFRRRDISGVPRGSPQPRLGSIPQSSVSSVSSAGRSTSSYISTISTASSMTSVGSFDRRSPNGRSPVSPTDTIGYESPFLAPAGLETRSPRSSISRSLAAQQQQSQSQSQPQPQPQSQKQQMRYPIQPYQGGLLKGQDAATQKSRSSGIAAKIQGFYMCECCPKKPKKFETQEELSAHEAEKQYECLYCGNRFKNKNEAERHQNSLHVRRHSWSCSALTGYSRAFHDSTTRPGEADTCGYCGEEFNRTGHSERSNQGRYPTDQDWEERVRHLQDVHKFRECNATKKFFRADHFRQHLKHSHAGTSGKWTNMLENACMIEEDPPVIGAR